MERSKDYYIHYEVPERSSFLYKKNNIFFVSVYEINSSEKFYSILERRKSSLSRINT